jgi:hypothetical protein
MSALIMAEEWLDQKEVTWQVLETVKKFLSILLESKAPTV